MGEEFKIGRYRHFRSGDHYRVLFLATRADGSDKQDVVYMSLKTGTIYTRDKEEFIGPVVSDGREVPRFEFYPEH